LTEAAHCKDGQREKMIEILFEKFRVPSSYVSIGGALPLINYHVKTGICLELGDGVSQAVPIYNSKIQAFAITSERIGGMDMGNRFLNLLNDQGYGFTTTSEAAAIREIKERYCFIQPKNTGQHQSATQVNERVARLSDGNEIQLKNAHCLAGEILFQPEKYGLCGKMGIQQVLSRAIEKSPSAIRSKLWENVYLSGGLSGIPGMKRRLREELLELGAPSNLNINIKNNSKVASWIGGAKLVCNASFKPMWITREQFEEYGSQIVHIKSF